MRRFPSVLGGVGVRIRLGGRDVGAGDARSDVDTSIREDEGPSRPAGGAPGGECVTGPSADRAAGAVDGATPTVDHAATAGNGMTTTLKREVGRVDGAATSRDFLSAYGHTMPVDTDPLLRTGAEAGRRSEGAVLEAQPEVSPGIAHDRPPTAQEITADDSVRQYRLEPARGGIEDVAADIVSLLIAVLVVATFRSLGHGAAHGARGVIFLVATAELALCVPVLAVTIGPTRRRTLDRQRLSAQLQGLALPLAAGATIVLGVWRVASAVVGFAHPQLDWVLGTCAVSFATVPAGRAVCTYAKKRAGKHTKVLIVGGRPIAERLSMQLNQMPGIAVAGWVEDDVEESAGRLGCLADIKKLCEHESVGHIVVALSGNAPQTVIDAFRIDALRPVQGELPITVVTPWSDELPTAAKVHGFGTGLAGINFAPASMGFWARSAKAAIDRAVALLAIVCLSPLFIAVTVAVRLTSRGPALFRQRRVGRYGREFSILKFRTMWSEDIRATPASLDGETTLGPFPKLKNDPRVTPVGRMLRRTSIDELPQLWNVLRGEMSLVGPRPFMLDDADALNGWALRRYSVRPGLTGLWQVSGRNELSFAEMCRLDQLYVNSWTLGLDFTILLRTVRAVVSRHGAY